MQCRRKLKSFVGRLPAADPLANYWVVQKRRINSLKLRPKVNYKVAGQRIYLYLLITRLAKAALWFEIEPIIRVNKWKISIALELGEQFIDAV